MLELIVPYLLRMRMEKQSLTEKEALTQIHASELYRQLEREETKIWYFKYSYFMGNVVGRKIEQAYYLFRRSLSMDKNEAGMNGKNVIDLFNLYRVIDYIGDYYEALHTAGRQYFIDDINIYIEVRQSSMG